MSIPAAGRREYAGTLFAKPEIVADRRADGSIWLRSTTPLQRDGRCVGDWLEHWAWQKPEKIFLGERSSVDAPWTTVTYKDALRQVRSSAAWILARGLSAEHPL
ncbi:MAG TPA: feruloyl-CoA synthase, partial [Bradyrhizobium sp.]|nr:feruloyl-CoA synthase [Bradyrhizobium sp.]